MWINDQKKTSQIVRVENGTPRTFFGEDGKISVW